MTRQTVSLVLICWAAFTLKAASAAEEEKVIDPVGRPEQFVQGKKSWCAVYFEDAQWQLRMTSRDGKKVPGEIFAGSVRIEGDRLYGDFQGLERAKNPKKADWIVLHADGRGFDFQFHVHGQVDGVSFKAGKAARSITFKVLTGGDNDPYKVLIGAKGVNPDKVPFTLPAHPAVK